MLKVIWAHPCADGHRPWLLKVEGGNAVFQCSQCDALGEAPIQGSHLDHAKQGIDWEDTI